MIQLEVKEIDRRGYIVCPHCKVRIVPPDYHKMTEGVGLCLRCKGPFKLNAIMARRANRKLGKWYAGRPWVFAGWGFL